MGVPHGVVLEAQQRDVHAWGWFVALQIILAVKALGQGGKISLVL